MMNIIIFMLMLMAPTALYAEITLEPAMIVEDRIFDAASGSVDAPLAEKIGGMTAQFTDGAVAGWVQDKPDGYVSYEAGKVFFPYMGALEIKVVVLDPAGLPTYGKGSVSLVSLYDAKGVPFFSVGFNDHDVAVGSYQLHPMVMEEVFGGTSFPYLAKLEGPLVKGMPVTIRVTWGEDPEGNRVYVNGRQITAEERKSSRNKGEPPGFEPTMTLDSFMHEFETFDGRAVGPPARFVIGRVGERDPSDRRAMYPPTAVAISSVTVWNVAMPPGTEEQGGPVAPGLKNHSIQ